jgi:hypothetical protein
MVVQYFCKFDERGTVQNKKDCPINSVAYCEVCAFAEIIPDPKPTSIPERSINIYDLLENEILEHFYTYEGNNGHDFEVVSTDIIMSIFKEFREKYPLEPISQFNQDNQEKKKPEKKNRFAEIDLVEP